MSSQGPAGKRSAQLDQVELWRSVVDSWKRLQRGAEKNLLRIDLTPAELRILRVLREEGTSPMNRLRREVLIAITQKGSSAFMKGEELHRRFVEKALSALDAPEVDDLVRLLRKLADASDSPQPQ
jgi:DNA-binding MarR family transcriptional regulator